MIKQLILIFIGGGMGSMLRFLFSVYINSDQIKWAPTLVVNLLGCLLLGSLLALSNKNLLDNNIYLLLGIGFCGGLTTFSTFSIDLFKLTSATNYTAALLYLALSVILGYIAVVIGYHLVKHFAS